jgi:hypothetical protein
MEENKNICNLCQREFKTYQALNSHKWRSHTEKGKGHKPTGNNKSPWNKGLTKDTDERVKKNGTSFSENLKSGKTENKWTGRKHKKETIKKLSRNGGYRKGSGRGKSGWYKGYWCDSTWELAWVIYNIDKGIIFERNTEGFEYFYLGKKFKYYPDFIMGETYYEIKGFMDKKNLSKIDQFHHKLVIISEKEINFFIDYVKEKYKVYPLFLLYEDGEKYKKTNLSKEKNQEKINFRIHQIKESKIDFTERGWITEASRMTGISRNKIKEWIEKNIPDLKIK